MWLIKYCAESNGAGETASGENTFISLTQVETDRKESEMLRISQARYLYASTGCAKWLGLPKGV
jgi:hypothetical protein